MTEEAFSDFYRAYKHRLVRLAHQRLHDPHLAEDIAQETLLRAHRLLPVDMHNPWPWLKRVAINACEDLRASRKETLRDNADELLSRDRAESVAERKEAVSAVERAIGSLTPIQKQTIRLSHYEERSYAEIASIQGVGVQAVKNRLHYSRQQLKTRLRQYSDYPLSALIPAFKLRRLWKFETARTLVKVATVATISVTAAGLLGPNHTAPSEAGEAKVRTSIPSDRIAPPVEVATYLVREDVSPAVGPMAASTASTSRDLTKPAEVPSGPSPEGPGSSGGPIGPVTLHCNPGSQDSGPVTDAACEHLLPRLP